MAKAEAENWVVEGQSRAVMPQPVAGHDNDDPPPDSDDPPPDSKDPPPDSKNPPADDEDPPANSKNPPTNDSSEGDLGQKIITIPLKPGICGDKKTIHITIE